jgi:hypothetical protein
MGFDYSLFRHFLEVWQSGLLYLFAKETCPKKHREFESHRFRQFMKVLLREDLDKVKPKFRQMVQTAWERGEEVPYGVIYLSDAKLTEADIKWANKLVSDGKITDD